MGKCIRCGRKAGFLMSLCRQCIAETTALTPEQRVQEAELHPIPKTSRLAILSLFFGFVWLAGLGSLAAIICGHLAKREIRQNPTRISGKGMATIGLILGYAGVLLLTVGVILAFRERAQLPLVYERSMRAVLYDLATAQEAYYSDHKTYAADLDALNQNLLLIVPGITVRVERASTSGWGATAAHVRSPKKCFLYHGDRAEFAIGASTQPDEPACQ
jgi:hypothetical protein